MPDLAALQSRMLAALRSGQVDDLTEVTNGATAHPQRLMMYRTSVVGALQKGLQHKFTALSAVLGTDAFWDLTWAYIPDHLPRTSYLGHYGNDLPAFLDRYALSADMPFLPDLARLEIAVAATGLEIADPPLSDWISTPILPGKHLYLPPSLRVIDVVYPVDDIHKAIHHDQPWQDIDLSPQPRALAVWAAPDEQARVRALPPAGGQFVRDILDGFSAEQALHRACREVPVADFTTILKQHVFAASFAQVREV